MKKTNYGISLMLAFYGFAQLVFAAILLCNGTIMSDSNLYILIYIVAIVISIFFALLSKCSYQKIIKAEQETYLNNKIETLKLEKENLEKQLKEATSDKTEDRNSLKLLREHEERMAIIKALGANYDKKNADAIQAKLNEIVKKLNEIVKTLDTIKQS